MENHRTEASAGFHVIIRRILLVYEQCDVAVRIFVTQPELYFVSVDLQKIHIRYHMHNHSESLKN